MHCYISHRSCTNAKKVMTNKPKFGKRFVFVFLAKNLEPETLDGQSKALI